MLLLSRKGEEERQKTKKEKKKQGDKNHNRISKKEILAGKADQKGVIIEKKWRKKNQENCT